MHLEGRLQLLLILSGDPAVHFLDLDLLPRPRLVELLLQDRVLKLVLLTHRLQLVLQVNPLQRLVLQVLLGVCKLARHLVVIWLDCFQLLCQSEDYKIDYQIKNYVKRKQKDF